MVLMGETELTKGRKDAHHGKDSFCKAFNPSISRFFVWLPPKLQNFVQSRLKMFSKQNEGMNLENTLLKKEIGYSTEHEVILEKQLQAWKENPEWTDQPPEIKVSVPKGSFCNLGVRVNAGLPPDAIYNIVIDPDNKRVFKNIQEVISREVLIDEGLRQVVKLEQAALWKFLWWSGTISVNVLVDQNRADHSMKFKQLKTGFMKRFEGCWRVEPLFVDENMCFPFKPKTWKDYQSCTCGKGRIASRVSLEQLIQPAIIPPPPISWYLRGITTRTTEMLVNDLLAETARIRGGLNPVKSDDKLEASHELFKASLDKTNDIKGRWVLHRRLARHRKRRLQCGEDE